MLYFSLFSGDIYDSPIVLKDAFQIPLKKRPEKSCKKCYGRMFEYYSPTNKSYIVCPKCVKTCIDPIRLLDTYEKRK